MAYYGNKTIYGSGEFYGGALVGSVSPLSAVCLPYTKYEDGTEDVPVLGTNTFYAVTASSFVARSVTGGFATITATNTFAVGEIVTQSGFTGADATAGLNGTFVITAASGTSYSFELGGTVTAGAPVGSPAASVTRSTAASASPTNYARIVLTWGTPNVSYSVYRIRRSLYGYPRSPSSGDLIYEGTPSTAAKNSDTHYVLPGNTYYYRVFVKKAASTTWSIFDQTFVDAVSAGNSHSALKNAVPRMYVSDYYDSNGTYVAPDSFGPPVDTNPLSQFLEGVGFWVDTFKEQAQQFISEPNSMSQDVMTPKLMSQGFNVGPEVSYQSQRRLLNDKWFLLSARGTTAAVSAFSSDVTGWRCRSTGPVNLVPSVQDVSFKQSDLIKPATPSIFYAGFPSSTSSDVQRGTVTSGGILTAVAATNVASNMSGYGMALVRLFGTHVGFNVTFEGSSDGSTYFALDSTNISPAKVANSVSNVLVTGGTATITAAHTFTAGEVITQTGFEGTRMGGNYGGMPANGLNGTFTITAATGTQYQFALTGEVPSTSITSAAVTVSGVVVSPASGSVLAYTGRPNGEYTVTGATGVLASNSTTFWTLNVKSGLIAVRARVTARTSGTLQSWFQPISVGSTFVPSGPNLTLPIGSTNTATSPTAATAAAWANEDTDFPNTSTASTSNVRVLQVLTGSPAAAAVFGTNYPLMYQSDISSATYFYNSTNYREYAKNLIPVEEFEAYNFMAAVRRVTATVGTPVLANASVSLYVQWFDIDRNNLLTSPETVIPRYSLPSAQAWAYISGMTIAPAGATHMGWYLSAKGDNGETVHVHGVHIEKVVGQVINLAKVDGGDYVTGTVQQFWSANANQASGWPQIITSGSYAPLQMKSLASGASEIISQSVPAQGGMSYYLAARLTPSTTRTMTVKAVNRDATGTVNSTTTVDRSANTFTAKAVSGGTATITAINNFAIGDIITQSGFTGADATTTGGMPAGGLNGTFTITSASRESYSFALTGTVASAAPIGTPVAATTGSTISIANNAGSGTFWSTSYVPPTRISVNGTSTGGATVRANSSTYLKGSIVRPSTANNCLYEAQTFGVTASSAPSFTSAVTVGATVTDGAVTWKCVAVNSASIERPTASMQVIFSDAATAANQTCDVRGIGIVKTSDVLGDGLYPFNGSITGYVTNRLTSGGTSTLVQTDTVKTGSYKTEVAPNPYRDPRTVNIVLEPDRVNLISQSTEDGSWISSGGNSAYYGSGGLVYDGTYSWTLTNGSAATQVSPWETSTYFGKKYIQPGTWVTFSTYIRLVNANPGATTRVAISFVQRDGSGESTRTYSAWTAISNTGWTRVSVAAKVPSGYHQGKAVIQAAGLAASNSDFTFDATQVELGRAATEYFNYTNSPQDTVMFGANGYGSLVSFSAQYFEKKTGYYGLAAQVAENIPSTTPYRLVSAEDIDWLTVRLRP